MPIRIDAPVPARLETIAADARRVEALGYDGLRVAELNSDPFLPLTLAAAETERIELMTSVAVAFARNPMSLAQTAHDLNRYAGGRLILGLGSQVRAHIERRFSMPWHKAAAQMREFLQAMNAIFDCWYEGERLDYEGEYYAHTLMPGTFRPEVGTAERPRLVLSATGPLMTKVAAEEADGMLMHPFSSARYIREVTLPAIAAGLEQRQRTRDTFTLDYAPMVAMGNTDQELETGIARLKERIAFYGCTVAYRPVLELHGWGALQDELIPLNRAHRQADMAALITDEMVETIGIVGPPVAVVQEMRARFDGLIDRTSLEPGALDEAELATLFDALRADQDS
ncbi:MAG: TIGR03617 family F420-dependent LLM class oxidoreductase [Pseudomonadota bacterium]